MARRRHTPRKRGIQYAAAFRFYRWRFGILDHPLSRMMTGWVCGARRDSEYGTFARHEFSQIQISNSGNTQRHCERSEAIHCYIKKRKLDCFVASLLAMTS